MVCLYADQIRQIDIHLASLCRLQHHHITAINISLAEHSRTPTLTRSTSSNRFICPRRKCHTESSRPGTSRYQDHTPLALRVSRRDVSATRTMDYHRAGIHPLLPRNLHHIHGSKQCRPGPGDCFAESKEIRITRRMRQRGEEQ
jgi:hypothetical protein